MGEAVAGGQHGADARRCIPPTWSDEQLERRLGAGAMAVGVAAFAVLGLAWAVYLPLGIAEEDADGNTGWFVATAIAAVLFALAGAWCVRTAWAYARRPRPGARLGRRFALAYLVGTIASGIAIPFYGVVLAVWVWPLLIACVALVLLLVRAARAFVMRNRRGHTAGMA